MKVHLDKKQTVERCTFLQLLRISRPTPCWEIHAWYELDPQERKILESNPDVKRIKLFEYEYRGADLSPSVGMLTAPATGARGGMRLVAYNSGEALNLENTLQQKARDLKGHLESLKDFEGSSVTEI